MNSTREIAADDFGISAQTGVFADKSASSASAVSWGAIFAGAAGAAVLSLILVILGTGLGLSSVSPWSHEGMSATTFGVSTILWITFIQIVASAFGGYLAGRLRRNWIDTHVDEVYFRDTAHGFLAWAIASLATAAMLTSVIGSVVGSGVQAGASVAGGAATAATGIASAAMGADAKNGSSAGQLDYFIDSLFRRDSATNGTTANPETQANAQSAGTAAQEVSRIFLTSLRSGNLAPEDMKYIGQMVAQRTGLSQQEAEKRVTGAFAKVQTKMRDAESAAREAADKARKASAYGSLWLFASLLIGAFVASFAATIGGRQRDA